MICEQTFDGMSSLLPFGGYSVCFKEGHKLILPSYFQISEPYDSAAKRTTVNEGRISEIQQGLCVLVGIGTGLHEIHVSKGPDPEESLTFPCQFLVLLLWVTKQ